jgi:hypothetical protein
LKGDLIIVSSCGTIGDLLRVVLPRQEYSHEAIFTRNYYALSHSTASEGRIADTVSGLGDRLDENKLKYAWPGALHESVDTAFNGIHMTDPDGKLRTRECGSRPINVVPFAA